MVTHNTYTESAAKCHILFACREAHFTCTLPCIECPGMWSPEDDCSKEFHGLSKCNLARNLRGQVVII